MAEPVDASLPTVDPRQPDLQAQVDDLRLAFREWRVNREYSAPTEQRLEQITLQCARLVESWQQMERRRKEGTADLETTPPDQGAVEGRLQQATGERIRALERAIEQEWGALPQGADTPARQLSEQAVSLAESCVSAASLALRGFANAESRVSALERQIEGGMAQISRDLQAILAELRSARPQSLPGAGAAFPLESVMRIHQELRESDGTAKPDPPAVEARQTRELPQWAESTAALAARVESLERTVERAASAAAPPERRLPRFAVIGLLVALAGVVLFGLWLQRRVDARLDQAALQIAAAEREKDATIADVREEAARQVADARESAAQAQIVGNVLAAPDLVRYWLTGLGSGSRAYAQVLFSRSRGMVFSAARLEPAGAGNTYQLWLLTREGPVSAGLMVPDSAGRVTLATDVPLTVPGRLTGALLTREPEGGRAEPSGDKVLVRVE